MTLFIIIILIAVYYVFSDLVPAYRNKNKKIIFVYLILTAAAVVLNILLLIKIKIPAVSVAIKSFLEAFIKFD